MRQLWSYQDYVEHLSHSNIVVRRWAFEVLKERFPRQYTPEIARLIGDQDEHLACSAPKYLAHFGAIDHASAILRSFIEDKGNVPSNCAIALGDMHYEPAVDTILDRLTRCENPNTFLGILYYLGKIRRNDCHQALRDAFLHLADHYFVGVAGAHLLDHRDPEDVPLVLGTYFKESQANIDRDMFLSHLMNSVGARGLYESFTKYGAKNILDTSGDVLKGMVHNYPTIDPGSEIIDELVKLLENGRYHHVITSLMFDAREIVRARASEYKNKDHLFEIMEYDALGVAFLEEFSKRSSIWKRVTKPEKFARNLISAVLACYFSILGRGGYLQALSSPVTSEGLIDALKAACPEFPEAIQNRLVELAPIQELKGLLTEELLTWGDIWTVRLMGRIGRHAFVPELIRVVRETDSLSYIHEDAIDALNGMDESAHERLLIAIQGGELTDAGDIFPLLEHLPYPESFDMAQRLWDEGEMDSFEIYAICLERIGDARGIEALQEIFFEGNSVFIGDSLEVLSVVHNRDIPEMPTIRRERKAQQKRQKRRTEELNELVTKAQKQGASNTESGTASVTPLRRNFPEIGRNDPCPCGSGRKYKKCCLNRDQQP